MFQQVYRNADLSRAAARVFFHFPILWLTGKYSLTNSKVFRFIPSKDRERIEERKRSLINCILQFGCIQVVQGQVKRPAPGLVNSVPVVTHPFRLALPVAVRKLGPVF